MSHDYWSGDGRGNGYDYEAGMSVNAVYAYDRGVKPLSKITADDLKEAGWTETKALAMRLAKDHNIWESYEWHHSGGDWFNRIDFYNPADLVEAWKELPKESREHLKKPPPKEALEEVRVSGSFALWGWDGRRRSHLGDKKFTGMLKGSWIHLDSGGRKKASGKHISWRRED